MGTSFYREALANIAKNPEGEVAFTFFSAHLVPETSNPADELAVGVYFKDRKIGHLPAPMCEHFRETLSLRGIPLVETTIDAVVRGGLNVDDRIYNYRLLLDYPASEELGDDVRPSFPSPFRLEPNPPLVLQSDGSYVSHVWLDESDREDLDRRLEVRTWTTPEWTSVNFYVLNRQRIGLGFKVYQMPKATFEAQFPFGVEASLILLSGKLALVRICASTEA